MYNISNYCENKQSNHELDNAPDINYFRKINIPKCEYLELKNVNTYFNNLNLILALIYYTLIAEASTIK